MSFTNPNNSTRNELFNIIYNLATSKQGINFSLLEKIKTMESLNECILRLNNLRSKCVSHFAFPNLSFSGYSYNSYQINKIVASELLKNVKNISAMVGDIPDVFFNQEFEYIRKDYEGFDINIFFAALPLLQLKKGFRLNYSYYYSRGGGSPSVFAENVSTKERFTPYRKYITFPVIPVSFFQLSLLINQLAQFYLYWHSNYSRNEIIVDREQALLFIEEKKNENVASFTTDLIKNILKIDFTPVVRTNDDIFEVKLVCFNEWKGFQNIFYSFTYPSLDFRIREETLVKYNCGYLF